MNIKLTLLVAFVLTSLNVSTNPLISTSPDIADSPVIQNEIEVIINDASYTPGDTYTIKVYYIGTLCSSQTTDTLRTMATVPPLWRGSLIVEVEKHSVNTRVIGINAPSLIIAQEVRHPGIRAIIDIDHI